MENDSIQRAIRRAQAAALVGLPAVWMAMFILHFRSLAGFFTFRSSYVPVPAEEQVARIARELTGSPSEIATLNRGPKHQIETGKIRNLGMTFGGQELLRRTVQGLVDAHRAATQAPSAASR